MPCIAIVAHAGKLIDRGLPFYMNAFKMVHSIDINMLYVKDDTIECNLKHMLPILRKVHASKNITTECVTENELHERAIAADELVICNADISPFIESRRGKLTIVPSLFNVPADRETDIKTVPRNVIVTAWFACKRDNKHNRPGEREHHIENFFKAITNADIFVITDNDYICNTYGWMLHVHVIKMPLQQMELYKYMDWITQCANKLGHISHYRECEPNVHLVWFSKIPICKMVSDMIEKDYAYLAWHDIAIMYDNYLDERLFTNDLIYPCFEVYPFPQTYIITTAAHCESLRYDIVDNRTVGGYWLFPDSSMLNNVYGLYISIIQECVARRIIIPADEVLYTLMVDLSSNMFLVLQVKKGNNTTYWGFIKQFKLPIKDYLIMQHTTVRLPTIPVCTTRFQIWKLKHEIYAQQKYFTLMNELSDIF